jgi:hypothetical protein
VLVSDDYEDDDDNDDDPGVGFDDGVEEDEEEDREVEDVPQPIIAVIDRSTEALERIRSLVGVNPHLEFERDNKGRLPLIYSLTRWTSCWTRRPPTAVQFLLERWLGGAPRGQVVEPWSGRTTRTCQCTTRAATRDRSRCCCGSSCTLSSSSGPNRSNKETNRGDLPVHHASEIRTARFLVETRPQALRERDSCGALLLHWAVATEHSVDSVRYLVEQNPQAVRERDRKDRIALH